MKRFTSIAIAICLLFTLFVMVPAADTTVFTATQGEVVNNKFVVSFYTSDDLTESFKMKYTYPEELLYDSKANTVKDLQVNTKTAGTIILTWGGYTTEDLEVGTISGLVEVTDNLYKIADITFSIDTAKVDEQDYDNGVVLSRVDDSTATYYFTQLVGGKQGYSNFPATIDIAIPDNRPEMTGIAAENKTVEFSGEAIAVPEVTGAPDGAVVTSKIFKGSEEIAEIVNAGTYTVNYEVKCTGYKTAKLSATVTVNKKPVTVTMDDQSVIYGDVIPEYTHTLVPDGVTVIPNVIENPAVGTVDITGVAEDTTGNYIVTVEKGTLTVNKRDVTIAVNAATKNYGDENPTFTADKTNFIGADAEKVNLSTTAVKDSDAGEYDIIATLDESIAGNYNVTINTPNTLTINKIAYNGDAVAVAKNVMINKANAYEVDMTSAISAIKEAAVVSAEIITDGTILSNVTTEGNVVKFDIASYATETENIAAIKVVVSSKNYENFDATINISTVDKEELTISGVTVANKTYDAVAVAPDKSGLTVTGVLEVPFDNETLVYTYEGTDETVYSSAEAPVNAGTYNLVVSVPEENENYAGSLTVPFEIAKKEVTITIADAHKKYEEKDPELTATVDTTVNGEELAYTLSRTEGEDVGSYAITAKLGENPNYEVKVVEGTFTIKQKDIEVKLIEDALIITYGEKVPEIKTDAPEGVNIIFETIDDPTVGEYNVKVTDIESKNYNVTNKDSIVCKLTVDAKEITIDSLNLEEKTVAFPEGDIVNGDAITLDFEQLDVVVDFEIEKATVKNFVLKDEKENEVRSENYVVATEALEVDVTIPEIAEEAAEGTVQEGVDATVKAIEGAKAIILETLTVGDVADGTTVSLDATKVDALVETISIAIDIVKDLKDKADLAVTLSEAAISFDKSALSAIAEGNAFVLKAAEYDESLLSEKQAEATKELNNAKVFSFNINDGGFDFGEGKVNVTVDFENTKNETVRAKYLKDDGTTEDVKVSYVDGKATLEISHFSEYVIYTARVSGGRPQPSGTVIKPATGGSTTKPEDDKKDDETGKPVASASIALKEKAEEIKFIEGYEDKTFRPDANATRNDVVSALTALFDITDVENAPSFGDTDDKAIKDLAAAGVINGYEDGTFKGHNDVTRAEFVKLVAAALKLETVEGATANFSDIEGHWAIEWIKTFVNKGYLVGYPDGTFRPEDKITRAEMVVVMTRVAGTVADADAIVNYADVDDAHWAYDYIMKAAK